MNLKISLFPKPAIIQALPPLSLILDIQLAWG